MGFVCPSAFGGGHHVDLDRAVERNDVSSAARVDGRALPGS